MGLSQHSFETVLATSSIVISNAETIATRMYEILFTDFPQTKILFEEADDQQHKKLAGAISAYAANIDNLEELSWAVDKMANTHVLKNIRPEHYPMVGASILKAMKDVLGDAATEEFIEAWKEAYFFLGDILVNKEKELYGTEAD